MDVKAKKPKANKRGREVKSTPHMSSKRAKVVSEPAAAVEDMSIDDFLNGGFESAALGSEHSKAGKKPAKDSGSPGSGVQKAVLPSKSAKKVKKGRLDEPVPEPASKSAVKERRQDRAAKASGKGDGGRGSSEARGHRSELEALKEQDPEFYKYLLETDKELLDFQEGGSDSEEGSDVDLEVAPELSGDDSEDGEGPATASDAHPAVAQLPQTSTTRKGDVLSQEVVEKWCQEAKEKDSLAALERLMKAYRVACHLGDEEEDLDATMRITNSTVFNKILIFMIKEAGPIFRRRLALGEGLLTVEAVRGAPRWRKMENTVKSFLGNSLHLLSEMTDEAMVVFMLRHLRPCIPFLISSKRLERRFLKHTLQLFGEAPTRVRVQAVLFIRHMAVYLPPPALSLAMKGVYRAFVINAKFMSPASLPHINFMASCVVELFGLDSAAAYEHAFGYLRQLAVLLRGAQASKTKEAVREVYCWQTISSLELWAKLLSTHSDKEELRPLIYPITQLIIATIRLVPTARYFPLRLRCIRALNKMSQATGMYVPVAPLLLETLQWQGLSKATRAGGRPPSDAVPQLRAGKQLLETSAFQQALVEEVFLLLAEHLAQWGTSASFPELSHPIALQIQQVAKKSKVEKFRLAAKGLAAAIEVNARHVLSHRQKLGCSPKDGALLVEFLASEEEKRQAPLVRYAATLAEKAAKQRALKNTGEMTLEAEEQEEDSGEEEEEEDLPMQAIMPQLKQKSEARRSGKKGTPTADKPGAAAMLNDDMGEDSADEMQDDLKDFQLSESEPESDVDSDD